MADEAQLAALDPNAPAAPAGAEVRTAALVVPSLPEAAPPPAQPAAGVAPVQAAAAQRPVNLLPASFARVAAATAPVGRPVNLLPAGLSRPDAAQPVAPTGRNAPKLARLAEASRAKAAVARVRPQAVAMLDKKLLSDTTFGDIMASAQAEARRR